MKKSLITFVLFIISTFVFTQNKAKTKDLGTITKSKLSEIKLHSEIIPALLKENKTFEIELTGKAGEALTQTKATSDEISELEINFFKNINAGTKLYFDVTYVDTAGKRTVPSTYVFKITK